MVSTSNSPSSNNFPAGSWPAGLAICRKRRHGSSQWRTWSLRREGIFPVMEGRREVTHSGKAIENWRFVIRKRQFYPLSNFGFVLHGKGLCSKLHSWLWSFLQTLNRAWSILMFLSVVCSGGLRFGLSVLGPTENRTKSTYFYRRRPNRYSIRHISDQSGSSRFMALLCSFDSIRFSWF